VVEIEIEIENSRSTTEAARRTCIQKVEEYMEILKEGPGIYQTGDLVYHIYGIIIEIETSGHGKPKRP
jgi:hypothetical protein